MAVGTTGGRVIYDTSRAPVKARGYALSRDELTTILKERVAPVLRDDEGNTEIRTLLVGVTETDFATRSLTEVLESRDPPKDWQVGEVLAEVFLSTGGSCVFPWPTSRDLRDLKASLPGTDLVGFQPTGEPGRPFRFAFGEVKTSNDADIPPQVMYGRHGLKQQLEDLRDTKTTRHILFLYLGYRAKGASWEQMFRDAAARYLADSTDVALFGVLVRDTKPADGDLSARASALARNCPTSMFIELLAIYLPADVIETLANLIEACNREARHANN